MSNLIHKLEYRVKAHKKSLKEQATVRKYPNMGDGELRDIENISMSVINDESLTDRARSKARMILLDFAKFVWNL